MGMLKEFRDFSVRGNVIDMAVGIIIGAAFGKITNSLVTDVLMPPIGGLVGGMDFSELAFQLPFKNPLKPDAPPVLISYGKFLSTVIDFVMVAFAMFLIVKQSNRFKGPVESTTKECPKCLLSIPIKATKCGHCTADL